MTSGQPIQLGGGVQLGAGVTVSGTVTLSPGAVAPGVGGAQHLDDLVDVDAPPAAGGVLERQADGQVRPVGRAALLADHVTAPDPHPAYDDLPAIRLYFENGLI